MQRLIGFNLLGVGGEPPLNTLASPSNISPNCNLNYGIEKVLACQQALMNRCAWIEAH